jgi:DnaJ family protein C protein 7
MRSLASPTCTDENAPIEFARSGDSSPIGDSVDESRNSGHCGNAHHDFFVFGGHAGYRSLATNATETNISEVHSADKESITCNSEQLNTSVAKDRTFTKFILQDAKHVFGSSDNDLPRSEPCEISTTVETSDTETSSFGSEDGIVKVSSIKVPCDIEAVAASELVECRTFDEKSFTFDDHNVASRNKGGVKGMSMNRRALMPKKSSANHASSLESVSRRSGHCSGEVFPEEKLNLKEASSLVSEDSGINCAQVDSIKSLRTTESGHAETEFTSAGNTEHSSKSDFIFSASTFNQSMLHSQRRHTKKKSGGMGNHASSIQSLPSSAIELACSEVSGSQQCVDLTAQWTEYSKIVPNRVTISRGAECSTSENFGDHDNCETWRLRYLHDLLLCHPSAYLARMHFHKG